MIRTKQAKKELPESSFCCTDPMCVEMFSFYELLKNHLDFGKHKYEKINTTQLGTVTEKWLKRYVEGNEKGKPREIANVEQMKYVRENRGSDQSSLGMGWAIPICNCRRLNDRQQTFLNKLFDDGEKTGNTLTAEEVFQEMQNKFSLSEYLSVGTIKSYFNRMASQFRTGKITLDHDTDCEIGEDDYELQMEDIECDREGAVITTAEAVECQPDLQKD